MPLYEYECDACGKRFEVIQKFSDPPVDACTHVRQGPGAAAACRRRRFSSRAAAGTSPTTRRRASRGGESSSGERAATARSDDEEPKRRRRPTECERRREPTAARRSPSRPADVDARARPADHRRTQPRPAPIFRSSVFEILPERLGEVGPLQREVDQRLQESQLVAGVVADAVDLAGVERPLAQQLAQAVGQLDLAGPIARRSLRARGRCRASGCSGR